MQQRDTDAENILKSIKIALVVAPVSGGALYDDWDLSEVDSVSPPMGLLWLAGMVRKNGGIATIHDAYARRIGIEAIVDELSGISPDVIGVSAMSCSYPGAKRLIERLKERMPRIPVVLGGVHVTALPQAVMDDLPGLDFEVLREGEVTLVELLAAIVRGGDFSKIPGIIFRKGGDIVKTPEREFLRDLDSLPKPAWDLLPSFPGPYSLSPIGTRSAKSASLITSRGCPGQCRFCDVGAMGKIVRVFSADYVLEMVEYLITHCGIRDFLIYDDNFVTVRPRVRKICEAIIDRRWNIQWSCSARVDMVDPELLALMRKAGCWQIEYGIESGSQEILDSMKKNITLDKIRRALRWTREAGIQTRGNFIFGYPGDTRQTIEESIRFACETDLDYFQQTFLTPYPGSAIYGEVDACGLFDRDPAKMNNLAINFVPQGMSEEELRSLSRKAFRRFYLRPGIIWNHLRQLSSLDDIRRLKLALAAFVGTVCRKPRAGKGRHTQSQPPDHVVVSAVKSFWEDHPLLGYELSTAPGSSDFFAAYDAIREIEFKYCFPLFNFESVKPGQNVLDVGCGNGWLLSRYARQGARVVGVDLTRRAIGLSLSRFKRSNLKGCFIETNAEELPFADNTFDIVTSLGTIHHTPRTEQCAREIIRVCKSGGRVIIAVYYENILMKRWFYPLTLAALWLLGRRDLCRLTRQQFVNRYDGPDNPLGKIYNERQARALVAGLNNIRAETHYFPQRFVPGIANLRVSTRLERFLDSHFGFLVYLEGTKK